jgi:ActR/RegA family two-component response regulator
MTLLSDERASQAITILLVEDDAPTLWRLRDALTKAGFLVTAAATRSRLHHRRRRWQRLTLPHAAAG